MSPRLMRCGCAPFYYAVNQLCGAPRVHLPVRGSLCIVISLSLCLVQMASHWTATSKYNAGAVSAAGAIIRTEGARALWGGLGPTLVGIIPYGGLSFCTYETLKAAVRKHYPDADGPHGQPLVLRLGLGGVAGLTAQTLTYPLHVVRRRMQVQSPHDPDRYRGILNGLQRIYLEEGFRAGLFKGLTLTWLKGPFSLAIAFTLNDRLKGFIGGWWAKQPEIAAGYSAELRKEKEHQGVEKLLSLDDTSRIKLSPIEVRSV